MDSRLGALPDDIDALKAALAAEAARAAHAETELAVAKAKAADDQALIAHQQLRIEKLTRQLYGPRSERTSRLLYQIELQFEELESSATEDEIAAEMAVAKTTTVAAFTRKRPARKPFPEHLPRERVIVPGPTTCLCCGGSRLRKLGENVTETLESIPRQWKVIQRVREKFTCRDCEKISQAPAPFHVIARGWAGLSLLAMILFEKFGQHQPLNRQAERYAKEGVPLSLSTLADQVGAGCALLEPILKRMEAHVFAAERLHGDDTTVPVLAKGKTDTGRCRVYARDDLPFGGTSPAGGDVLLFARPGGRASPRHTRRTMPEFSRPMLTAATTSSTSLIASQHRSSKRPAGSMPAARSLSWRMWPRMPAARRRTKRQQQSRHWSLRRSGASTPCSRSNARSMARVPSSAELFGRSSARHRSPIWKAGCASNVPSSRAAMKSPKPWSTCSNAGPPLPVSSMMAASAYRTMPRKERSAVSP
jgi:transposase